MSGVDDALERARELMDQKDRSALMAASMAVEEYELEDPAAFDTIHDALEEDQS